MGGNRFFLWVATAAALALGACTSDGDSTGEDDGIGPLPGGDDAATGTTGGASGGADSGAGADSGNNATTGPATDDDAGNDDESESGRTYFDLPPFPDLGMPGSSCDTDPDADEDGDGFSVNDGDCNDCDANVNPGAIEVEVTEPDEMGVVPEPADEDCDGIVDNVPEPCDAGLSLDSVDPLDAAAAMGLCKVAADDTDWGIISADYVTANGGVFTQPLQHGLMDGFGPNVTNLEGDNVLVLSTGYARIPGQANTCGTQSCTNAGAGTAPAGFPQDVPECDGLSNINDDVALEVTLRAPTNATGYAYSFDFYSFEYPEWVCTEFNDQYIAIADPAPPGAINGNISFDAMTNPVSVNIAFFEVCAGCPLGEAELEDTGFDTWNDAGATSWLVTTAPVDPGTEITLRFAIFDTGDALYDSTVLLDNFRWIADGGTVVVGTIPEG